MQKRNMELLSPPDRKIERKKRPWKNQFLKVKARNLRDHCWKDRTCTYILWLFTRRFWTKNDVKKWSLTLNQLSLPSPIQKWDNVSNLVQKREGIKRKDRFSPFFFLFLSKSDSPSHDASVDTYVYVDVEAQTYIYTRDIFSFLIWKITFKKWTTLCPLSTILTSIHPRSAGQITHFRPIKPRDRRWIRGRK